MKLITLVKFSFIMFIAIAIFLGTPIVVGMITPDIHVVLLAFMLGGFAAGVFVAYVSPVILTSTFKYLRKKEAEKQHE